MSKIREALDKHEKAKLNYNKIFIDLLDRAACDVEDNVDELLYMIEKEGGNCWNFRVYKDLTKDELEAVKLHDGMHIKLDIEGLEGSIIKLHYSTRHAYSSIHYY